ncbi:hypothetical protein BH23BAC3_BH23BAC3_06690 [soil metagenome]
MWVMVMSKHYFDFCSNKFSLMNLQKGKKSRPDAMRSIYQINHYLIKKRFICIMLIIKNLL